MRAWHREQPDIVGAAATVTEGFKLGQRIFGDLFPPQPPRT